LGTIQKIRLLSGSDNSPHVGDPCNFTTSGCGGSGVERCPEQGTENSAAAMTKVQKQSSSERSVK
jgi:hypothetical protein